LVAAKVISIAEVEWASGLQPTSIGAEHERWVRRENVYEDKLAAGQRPHLVDRLEPVQDLRSMRVVRPTGEGERSERGQRQHVGLEFIEPIPSADAHVRRGDGLRRGVIRSDRVDTIAG